jgi:DNA polymerase-1
VARTSGLWWYWRVLRSTKAYAREISLLPVLDAMTAEGLPLDVDGLAADLPGWLRAQKRAANALGLILGSGVDLGKHEQVADRLEKLDLVKEWVETPKGKRSLAYESLAVLAAEEKFDRAFAEIWGYYSTLSHVIVTFAHPWLKAGVALHPQWNATRQERGGARTGRLSSNPNIQNIIKKPPTFAVPKSWVPIPRMRHYVLAPRGQRLVGADISQQELRVLAHAMGEPLISWYREDPTIDLHVKVSELIAQITGMHLERGVVKTINFAKIYGAGVAKLASQLGRTEDDARTFKRAHTQALPGVGKWERKLAESATFQTVGGRTYCHDPERPYKSPNTYIQGSSADQSKEVMLAVQPEAVALGGSLCSMAHDEFVARVPSRNAKRMRGIMLDVIESTGWRGAREMFSVPMRGEGYIRKRWQE